MQHFVRALSAFFVLSAFSLYEASYEASATPPQVERSPDQRRAAAERTTRLITKGSPASRISWRMDRIGPSLLLKLNLRLEGETPRAQATDFITRYAALWGNAEIKVTSVTERAGRAVAVINASVEGLPLLGQASRLSIKNGHAQHLSNGIGSIGDLIRAEVDDTRAQAAALKAIRGGEVASVKRAALHLEPGRALEVFEVRVVDRVRLRSWVILVDGRDGSVTHIADGEVR